ncbi:HAMP domain protein [Treponema phagedenis]|uniref:HAMP domain protein n=1 Tax=Treponema phagedenis TaxID=162 RepID=A0A0B7GUM6_TREPH|nr:HAMP domain protein [Treponema phagedenis]
MTVLPPPSKIGSKKLFSIRKKLLIIFGVLVVVSVFMLGFLSLYFAKKAVTEKVEAHLTDKAVDTAEIISGRINIFLQFLVNTAKMPIFGDDSVSFEEKARYLGTKVDCPESVYFISIADIRGNLYTHNLKTVNITGQSWFTATMDGKDFISEPFISVVDGDFIMVVGVPIYGKDKHITGSLCMTISGLWLCDNIKDIIVGKTGECYVLDLTGTVIADPDVNLVTSQENTIERAKTDPTLASIAAFEKQAITSENSVIGLYTWEGSDRIASFAKIKKTGWAVIVYAPIDEFMGTIQLLRKSIWITGLLILIIALIIIFITARLIVRPITVTVNALQNIAQGDGDLTVRLPITGNDEITKLSDYFNQTIKKIREAVKQVGDNTIIMEDIGTELSSNMAETASAVHQISTNIDGVKRQALTQAASVTETAATIEEIIRTIKQLNTSIENQAASVEESSSSIEEMVANIGSIGKMLNENKEVIDLLHKQTLLGKEGASIANAEVAKLTEKSDTLMDASQIIQHIASQTNLLAMNAAIEATHAGDTGKGFAVVADEIRKLAEESNAQGKEISAMLKESTKIIEDLAFSGNAAEHVFDEVVSLAKKALQHVEQIDSAMQEQKHGSSEVLTAIKDIHAVTSQVKDGSAEMLTGGESVAQEMQKLDNLTLIITGSMNEMASGIMQINNAVQEVNEITQKNKESIENW